MEYQNNQTITMINSVKTNTMIYLPKIGISIAIVIFFYIIAKIIHNNTKKIINKSETDNKILYKLFGDIFYYIIVFIGIMIALVYIGFNLNTLLVVFGSIGLAIALAIQGTVSQVVSGIMILFFKYFKTGDIVEINNTTGYINNFNLLNTSIIDPLGVKFTIPNNNIINGTFTNYCNQENIYVDIITALSNNNTINYDTLLSNIKNIIMKDCKYIINPSDPKSVIITLADTSTSGTKITARVLIKNINYFSVQRDVRLIIRKLLSDDNVLLLDNSYLSNNS